MVTTIRTLQRSGRSRGASDGDQGRAAPGAPGERGGAAV